MLNFFSELQICSLSFGFLLTSNPKEVLIDERVDVAFQIDLFLDLVHCLVQLFRVDFDAENSLLKLQIVSKLKYSTYQHSLHLVHSKHRRNRANLLFDIHEDGRGRVYRDDLVNVARLENLLIWILCQSCGH